MADVPLWKRNLERALTPENRAKGQETRRERKAVTEALRAALDRLGDELSPGDRLGMEAFFAQFGRSSDENRRALLTVAGRLIPQEIHGNVDTNVVVKVVTLAGPPQEIDVTVPRATAQQEFEMRARRQMLVAQDDEPGDA